MWRSSCAKLGKACLVWCDGRPLWGLVELGSEVVGGAGNGEGEEVTFQKRMGVG
jgi:hypothetical protein